MKQKSAPPPYLNTDKVREAKKKEEKLDKKREKAKEKLQDRQHTEKLN